MERERFVREYANSKIRRIKENKLVQDWYKNDTTSRINRAVELYYQWMLSADEAMRIIADA